MNAATLALRSPVAGCFHHLRRHALAFALGLLLLLPASPALANDIAAGFDAANKLYDAGKFSEASAAYEKLLLSGRASSAIYYNWGNACFKSSQIGRAIAAYRQASDLAPRDPDLRANLTFARNQVAGPTLVAPRWERWLNWLSLNEWAILTAVAVWLWLGLLTLPQFRPALKPAVRTHTILLGAAVVVLGALLLASFQEHRLTRTAIVIVKEAAVRSGPLDEAKSVFAAHDGAELPVLDEKDDWLQVGIDSPRTGWVRRDQTLVAR